jgi:hypothetical protein
MGGYFMKRSLFISLLVSIAASSSVNAFDFSAVRSLISPDAITGYVEVAKGAAASAGQAAAQAGSVAFEAVKDQAGQVAELARQYPNKAMAVAGGVVMAPLVLQVYRRIRANQHVAAEPEVQAPIKLSIHAQQVVDTLWNNFIVQIWDDLASREVRLTHRLALDLSGSQVGNFMIIEGNQEFEELLRLFYEAMLYGNFDSAEEIALLIEHSKPC